MTVASGAPTRLGGVLNQNTHIVLATKAVQLIRAVFSFFGTTIAACFRWLVRLITALVMSAIFVIGGVAIAIPLNQWHNERNNSIYQQTDGTFVHTDKRTTAILNYMTGHGPLPHEEVLVVTRLYVKNLLEEAEMEMPENINSLTMKELAKLVLRWQQENSSEQKLDPRMFGALFHDISTEATRPPLEHFGPEVSDGVWEMVADVGAPKIRWLEERNEYASQLVASSAPDGDRQAFYNPLNHTIYIRYGDSALVLFDEAPHSMQFREEPYRSWARLIGASVYSIWRGVVTEANRVYREGYSEPDTLEGEAHTVKKAELLQRHGLEQVSEQLSTKPDNRYECVLPAQFQLPPQS